jgi:hypothetical protein
MPLFSGQQNQDASTWEPQAADSPRSPSDWTSSPPRAYATPTMGAKPMAP